MPTYTRGRCEDCGGEIIYEKDSTGEYLDQDEADSYEHPNLCGTCAAKRRESEGKDRESEAAAQKGGDE